MSWYVSIYFYEKGIIGQYKNIHKLPKEIRHKLVHSPRNRISHNDIYFMGEFQWPAISPLYKDGWIWYDGGSKAKR